MPLLDPVGLAMPFVFGALCVGACCVLFWLFFFCVIFPVSVVGCLANWVFCSSGSEFWACHGFVGKVGLHRKWQENRELGFCSRPKSC